MFNTIGIITKPKDFTSEQTGSEAKCFSWKTRHHSCWRRTDCNKGKRRPWLLLWVAMAPFLTQHVLLLITTYLFLGINLGYLGFLVDLAVERMTEAVAEILEGKYIKERRALLSCQVERGNKVLSHTFGF